MTKTILLIEDNFAVREGMEDFLALEGYSVVSAENGRTGLEKLARLPRPCLVLLDMMMPVMGGRQFLDAYLLEKKYADIPVVVLSAIANGENTRGAAAFLRKPPDLDKLLEVVETHCV